MAVLKSVPGLSVTIIDEKEQPATELYNFEEPSQHLVKAYIQAKAGAKFGIHVNLTASFNFDCEAVTARIKINGKTVPSPLFLQSKFDPTSGMSRVIWGVTSGLPPTIRHFYFADIQTGISYFTLHGCLSHQFIGDADGATEAIDPSTIGSISVVLHRCTVDGKKEADHGGEDILGKSVIDERSVKGKPVSMPTM